jgi:hypothetical protein
MDINKLYNDLTNNYLFVYLIIICVLILSIGWVNFLTCP